MVKEAEQFGRTSVVTEMLRSDIKNLETVLASLTNEREKLRVELNTSPCVTLLNMRNSEKALVERRLASTKTTVE